MTPYEHVRAAIQQVLDVEGDGWHVKDWVVCLGLEKIEPDGKVEATAWLVSPPDQADYVTDGLLAAAQDLRAADDSEDDD